MRDLANPRSVITLILVVVIPCLVNAQVQYPPSTHSPTPPGAAYAAPPRPPQSQQPTFPSGAPQPGLSNAPSHLVQPSPEQAAGQPSDGGPGTVRYGFRPNLTNPQFGQCLQMEKNWKAMWETYRQQYEQFIRMNPADPQYVNMSHFLHNSRLELDAAWKTFEGYCIYYPARR